MYRIVILVCAALLLVSSPSRADFLDSIGTALRSGTQTGSSRNLDSATTAKGLKEALATGTERAVADVARTDGYFGNQLIRILLPDKLQQTAELLKKVGYEKQVDELVLSMNRAAEKAAPKAAGFFGNAIRSMTLEDAKGILTGGDTAATRYFEQKTRPQLFESFKPTVSQTMDQVGTARAYREMTGKLDRIPMAALVGKPDLDLNSYVTNKALDGLFTMLAEEEKKIRTNPAARTTELLRKVFGSN